MHLKTCKKNELDVCKYLNDIEYGRFRTTTYEYSHFDIFGTLDEDDSTPGSTHYCIEVKKRRKNDWNTWYLEESKVINLLKEQAKAKTNGHNLKIYLVNSCEGHFMYNIDDIINYPIVERLMNQTTAKGFNNEGKKVLKKVYEFPKDIWTYELKSGETNPETQSKALEDDSKTSEWKSSILAHQDKLDALRMEILK